jgi:hypothetical protein
MTFDHASLVANLRNRRSAATYAQIAEGRGWYPSMLGVIRAIADEASHATGEVASDEIAVGVFAAFSQNATWKANVTMATRYLHGEGRGMARVLNECYALEEGADPTDDDVLGLKRSAFCANLLGDHERVTCDRWHLRAAFDTSKPPSLSAEVRSAVTAATVEVAREFGESPAACQAVIWCVVRGDGK